MTSNPKKFLQLDQPLSSSPDWTSIINTNEEPSLRRSVESDFTNAEENNGNYESEEDEILGPIEDAEGKPISMHQSGNTVREDYSVEFFQPLWQDDCVARASALEGIVQLLRDSVASKRKDLVRFHLATIARYASGETPFQEITSAFSELKKIIEEDGTLSLPSADLQSSNFIPEGMVPRVDTDNKEVHALFVECFIQTGRVTHLDRVLGMHPSYLKKFYMTYNFIMRESGPLPIDWRNYIAILASARFKCRWSINLQEKEFYLNGGDSSWLQGVNDIPTKIKNLLPIIEILCHQPWLIKSDHIAHLVKGEDSWSIGELVHAILVICTFKAISSVVLGCGITKELDFPEFLTPKSREEPDLSRSTPPGSLSLMADTNKIMKLLQGGWESEEPKEKQEHLFVNAETECIEDNFETAESSTDIMRYIGRYKLKHCDFDVKSKEYSIFRVQDYCWKEHGFELVRRFLPDAAALLDEEFDHIYVLTYQFFNESKNIDTLPFRRALWYYVQRIKGMFHDDYNYQEVNLFVNRVTKNYLKKLSCYPDRITKSDFGNLGYQLKPDEKVHISLLAVESSKQSELLWGLHAVKEYMFKKNQES